MHLHPRRHRRPRPLVLVRAYAGSSKPSYTAVVATMDRDCSQYYTTVGQQESRKEIVGIEHLERTVVTCLMHWKEKNECPPEHIIIYRDGVAHNQFHDVINYELQAFHNACSKAGGDGYRPAITFVCVQEPLILTCSET